MKNVQLILTLSLNKIEAWASAQAGIPGKAQFNDDYSIRTALLNFLESHGADGIVYGATSSGEIVKTYVDGQGEGLAKACRLLSDNFSN